MIESLVFFSFFSDLSFHVYQLVRLKIDLDTVLQVPFSSLSLTRGWVDAKESEAGVVDDSDANVAYACIC